MICNAMQYGLCEKVLVPQLTRSPTFKKHQPQLANPFQNEYSNHLHVQPYRKTSIVKSRSPLQHIAYPLLPVEEPLCLVSCNILPSLTPIMKECMVLSLPDPRSKPARVALMTYYFCHSLLPLSITELDQHTCEVHRILI